MNRKSHQQAFTLIEMCVVIIISGLLLAAFISGFNTYIYKKKLDVTKANLAQVQQAITDFADQHNYYPYPADITFSKSNANFARASAATCTANVCSGMVPSLVPNNKKFPPGHPDFDPNDPDFITLVPMSALVDGWGRRLTYAVSPSMAAPYVCTNPTTCAPPATPATPQLGVIQVVEGIAGPSTPQPFILLSHGPDGKGAYNDNGQVVTACNGGSEDTENCDGNATFRITEDRSTAGGALHNDDFAMIQGTYNNTACSGGQITIGIDSDGKPICQNPPTNTCLAGSVVTSVTATSVACSPLPTVNCGAGQMLGAMNSGTPVCRDLPSASCGAGRVIVNIVNGQPVCGDLPSGGCVAGNIVTSINRGTPVCAPLRTIDSCPSGWAMTSIQNGRVRCDAKIPTISGPERCFGSQGEVSCAAGAGPGCSSTSDHAYCPSGYIQTGTDICLPPASPHYKLAVRCRAFN